MQVKLLVAFLFLSTAVSAQQAQHLKAEDFFVCGKKKSLEIAKSSVQREKGLMFRKPLGKDRGMIFVFSRPQVLSFWMKNVGFNIDIGYFSSKGRLLSWETMKAESALMQDRARKFYPSNGNAQFAVELAEGFFKKQDVKKCKLSPIPES